MSNATLIKLELLRIAAKQYDTCSIEDIISKAQVMFDFLCGVDTEKDTNKSLSSYSEILKKLEKMNADNNR